MVNALIKIVDMIIQGKQTVEWKSKSLIIKKVLKMAPS